MENINNPHSKVVVEGNSILLKIVTKSNYNYLLSSSTSSNLFLTCLYFITRQGQESGSLYK